MSNDIIQINSNILKSASFYVEFFDLREYNQLANDFTMYVYWNDFLNNAPKFTVPLLSIDSMVKTNLLWFRNSTIQDKAVISVDNSEEYNIMNFITNGVSAKDVDLEDLIYLGAILKTYYIDAFGNTQEKRLMVGRVTLNTFSNSALKLNITGFNEILKGSDFESNVVKYGDNACYNYISLEQAFSNIFNVPHNIIDKYAYTGTPFRLNNDTYIPSDDQDIVLTDGNLEDNWIVYAEDKTANNDGYEHCQFFYLAEDCACGVKMTRYNNNGDEIEKDISYTPNWNVWGNTVDASNNWADNFYKDNLVTHYSRFFRPFKVVKATDNEELAFDGRNGRVIRNINLDGEFDQSNTNDVFYDPIIKNPAFEQQIVSGGQYLCEAGDTLIYFEQLGDIRFENTIEGSPSATVLYDQHAHIFVYNFTKDIVYFNHISSLVQSTPFPKMWLQLRDLYMNTEKMYFASRLDYTSANNNWFNFASAVKPYCHVDDDSSNWNRCATARSFKQNQDQYGNGGNFVGEKQVVSNTFGFYDIDDENDKTVLENMLDYIQENIKPKSVKISDDGQKIYFMRNIEHGFDNGWNENWTPDIVSPQNYSSTNQFPSIQKQCFKFLFNTDINGNVDFNKSEVTDFNYCNYESTINPPYNNEICDFLNNSSIVLQNGVGFNSLGAKANAYAFIRTTSTVSTIADKNIINSIDNVSAVNIHANSSVHYWSYEDKIYQSLTGTYKDYDDTWNVLHFNRDINRAIIQQQTELVYYDTLNDIVLENSTITGFEYILSMVRTRFIFTNPLDGKSDELIRIGSVTSEVVRLLSYSGTRYQGARGLANTFFKNMNYDNNGILQIGFTDQKNNMFILDGTMTAINTVTTKYDVLEWNKYVLSKPDFRNLDNGNNTNQEEDNNNFDADISISMFTKSKDVDINVTVNRISSTEIKWEASNEFSDGIITGIITETDFTFFTFDLTDIFTGITITCNFYNTELSEGEKFAGRIKRRELEASNIKDSIETEDNEFIFLENKSLTIKPSFLYELNSEQFKDELSAFFLNGLKLKKMIQYNISVPQLLLFNENYKILSVGDLLELNGEIVDTDGWVTCYIEKLSYDFKERTTKFNLITFK